MTVIFALLVASFGIVCNVSAAQGSEPSLDSQIESLRADLKADKVAIITETMRFDDQQSKLFWPVYRKYEVELTKVNDERMALVKSYSDKFITMTDADAKEMIDQSIDFESRRINLKRKYAKEFQKAGLSPLTVAKFLQLEHRLDLLVDMSIASELPSLWVKPAGQPTRHQ